MSDKNGTFWSKYSKWIFGVLALIAFTAVWHLFPVKEWVDSFTSWVDQRGAWGMVIFIAGYALVTVLFFPGSLLTIGAGLAFGLWRGFLAVSAGATLGAALAFLVARYFIRSKTEAWAKNNPKFEAMDKAIGEQGWKVVALLRLSPLLPFNLSNFLFGVTKIGFWPYIAASWAGMLPGTFLYVYIGAAGKQASSGGGGGPWKWVLIGVGLLATVFVTIWISKLAKKAMPVKDKE